MLGNTGEFGSHSEDRWDGRTIKLSMLVLLSFTIYGLSPSLKNGLTIFCSVRQTVVDGEIPTPSTYIPSYNPPPPSSYEHRQHSPAFSSSSEHGTMGSLALLASPIARTEAPDCPFPHIDAQPSHVPAHPSNVDNGMEMLSPPASPLNDLENPPHVSRPIDHVNPPAEPPEASLIEHPCFLDIPLSQVEAQFDGNPKAVDDLIATLSLMDFDVECDTTPSSSHLPYCSIPSGATCVSKPSGMSEVPEVSTVDGPPSPPADDVIEGFLQYPEDDAVSEDILDRDLRLPPCDTMSESAADAHSQGPSKIDPSTASDFAFLRPPSYPPYVLQSLEPINHLWLPTPPESTASPSTIRHLTLNPGPSTLSTKGDNIDSVVPLDPKVIEPFTEANRLRTPLSVIVSRSSPIIPWLLPDEVAYACAGLFNVRTIKVRFQYPPFYCQSSPNSTIRKASTSSQRTPLPQNRTGRS